MPSQPALRIVLVHTGKSFRVESVMRIRKIVQPSEPLGESYGAAESWITIQGADGKPVFRRSIHNPLGACEVFTGEERDMRRAPVAEPSGVVSILVPELAEAEKLVLHASEVDAEKGLRSAEPVFEVSLKHLFEIADQGGADHGRR